MGKSAREGDGTKGSAPRSGTLADPLGVNSEIGRKLKQYYDDLVAEEVPDRFAELLNKLDKTESPKRKKD